jgi:hypothetical protein
MSSAGRVFWRLVAAAALFGPLSPALAQNAAVTVTVNAAANRHAINPGVYGVAFATQTQLADLNCPLNRQGGNATSRYNWQLNASNRGLDWYFESIPEDSAAPGELGDSFISTARAAGADPMLTIPMLAWVARLGPGRSKLASFSQAKYGAQQHSDTEWFPDAGNGVLLNGHKITGNDPNDANVPVDSFFQQGWVNHLVSTWGTAANGGLRYYILDNEYSLWHGTHRDVHPQGATMDEVRDRMLEFAARIKDVDPSALVIGPEEWGWPGYLYSGYDQQQADANGWTFFPDSHAHGDWLYVPWLLDQFRQNNASSGRRLLDVLSLHYYPQAGEYSWEFDPRTQRLRNRSTRALWDPNYLEESWIADHVQLIPRMKNWVAQYYPGTRTAITEYNWGWEGHMNTATTQADLFGIFGREGLDLATYWTTPFTGSPTYNAIKLYRNYDGSKSVFGDVSVQATSTANADDLACFAAQRSSDNSLTVMVISKDLPDADGSDTPTTPVTLNLANFNADTAAQVWQLKAATNAITRLADVGVTNGSLSTTLPAQSITLFVIPQAAAATYTLDASPGSVAPGGPLTVHWTAPAGRPSTDWIALYKVGNPNTAYGWWQYTQGAASGTFNLTAPALSGQYEFRYLQNNGFTSVATSNTVTVTGGGGSTYSLTASPGSVAAGSALSISWTAPNGRPATDWIALYKVGDPNTAYGWWQYTQGAIAGSYNLTAPATAGQYEFRYLQNNGFTSVATSNTVTVTGGGGSGGGGSYTLTASPATVGRGASLTISWTAPAGRPANDWIALYRVGDPNTFYQWWQYTGGAASGSFTLNAPNTAGQYEFRYLLNDGYSSAATSNTVTVH